MNVDDPFYRGPRPDLADITKKYNLKPTGNQQLEFSKISCNFLELYKIARNTLNLFRIF